jgi:hypothetical protein
MKSAAPLGVEKRVFQKLVNSATDFRSAFSGRLMVGLRPVGFNMWGVPLDFGRLSGSPIFGGQVKLLRKSEKFTE